MPLFLLWLCGLTHSLTHGKDPELMLLPGGGGLIANCMMHVCVSIRLAFLVQQTMFRQKLTVLQELATAQPSNAAMFKFVADPPTVTMQRLKALTTGSLPTFVDVGRNFDSSEIAEDNIIHQAVAAGKKVQLWLPRSLHGRGLNDRASVCMCVFCHHIDATAYAFPALLYLQGGLHG